MNEYAPTKSNFRKIIIGLLIAFSVVVVAAYLLLSPVVATPLYYALLFYPAEADQEYYDACLVPETTRKEVSFKAPDGSVLHGFYFKKKNSPYTILVSHGNAGNVSYRMHVVQLLSQAGASVFIYDYEGYGKSTGEPSLKNICDDGLAAFDYLVNNLGIKPNRIVLYGESLGSGVSCHIASERPHAGIILQSGFSSLMAVAREKINILNAYPPQLYPSPSLDNKAYLANEKQPLLIIHGTDDSLIPISQAYEVYKTGSQKKTLLAIEGAGHNDVYMVGPDKILSSVRSFLESI